MNVNYTLICIDAVSKELEKVHNQLLELVPFTTPLDDNCPANTEYNDLTVYEEKLKRTLSYLSSGVDKHIL